MRRPALVLILCLLAGLLAWWQLRHRDEAAAKSSSPKPAEVTSAVPKVEVTQPAPDSSVQSTNQGLDDEKTGPRYKRAYMLSLDKGALTFLQAQDIEGDFAKPRRKPEEWSGMLRCRLMSEQGAVLAEELLPAPDQVCAVLDPISGTDKPVQFTVPSGPVFFQVRLPRVKDAVRLDISRIIQPADSTQPGLEGQLGSIPLPRS